jgi:hypothetical protein
MGILASVGVAGGLTGGTRPRRRARAEAGQELAKAKAGQADKGSGLTPLAGFGPLSDGRKITKRCPSWKLGVVDGPAET